MKLIAGIMTVLILWGVFVVFGLGQKPKPCPRHICFPQSEVVTVEQMMAADPERFKKK